MLINIENWDFSTHRKCEICDCKPGDYWNMAYIEYKGKMLWACTCCLGYIICDMQIMNKYGIKV